MSSLSNTVERMRTIGDAVAVAIVRSDLSGSEKAPEDVVPTRLTVVLEKRGNAWRIAAAHNATLADDAK